MAECNAETALAQAKCYQCLSEREMKLVQIWLLGQIWGGDMSDISALLAEAKCFQCLSDRELQYVQSQLLCNIDAGGTGGSGCMLCGIVDPTTAPDCDCALYYNTVTSSLWYWDGAQAQWFPLIQ